MAPSEVGYFTKGSRPFLLQFPACVGRLVLAEGPPERKTNDACSTIATDAVDRDGRRFPARVKRDDFASSETISTATAGLDSRQVSQACCPPRRRNRHEFASSDTVTYLPLAPDALHTAFDPAAVQAWDPQRFKVLGKVQDAVRNCGQVYRMLDSTDDRQVAVKKMPNNWVCMCHDEFVKEHPQETELPWQDIGCTSFLNGVGYLYGCPLLGVYRDAESTNVVTALASEGDLFSWCGAHSATPPGSTRESLMLPLAIQVLESVRNLHEMSIVHRDLSLENLLVSTDPKQSALHIQVIDFSMASTGRPVGGGIRGKASYQAPEVHAGGECDGFLSDAFAVGVILYAALVKDYPWMSTRPGGCKCFEFVCKHGFRAYVEKRRLRGGRGTVAQHMSEALLQLLEGLLALEPAQRLTLGESVWTERKSVWQEPWLVQ